MVVSVSKLRKFSEAQLNVR